MNNKTKKILAVCFAIVLLKSIVGAMLTKPSQKPLEQEHANDGKENAGHRDHEKNPSKEGNGHKENHEEKQEVTLTDDQLKRFDIQTLVLTKNHFQPRITLPGEIALNENKITHIVASVPGTVKEVFKGLGEEVQAGKALATLQSREMADIKSSYIAAHKNLSLQKDVFERDEKLLKKGLKAKAQFVQTQNLYENAKINLEQAKQKLLALSMNEEQIQELLEQTAPLNIYTINSPLDGKIIERHITLGEIISSDKQVFVIANLDTLWINLSISAEDLPKIKNDQKVEVFAHKGESTYSGLIMYVSPVINEDSRTGRAIIQLDNKKRDLHPGDFVKAQVLVSEQSALLSLPSTAVQRIEGKSVVFVKTKAQTFEARAIDIKGSDKGDFVEIMGGVSEGEEIALKNTFLLKAELGKSEAEHSH